MIVFALPWKHVEVEKSERLASFGVGYPEEFQILDPFDRRVETPNLYAKDRFVNVEHALKRFVVGEIDSELLRIDRELLLLELVAVIPPVPRMNPRVLVTSFLHL